MLRWRWRTHRAAIGKRRWSAVLKPRAKLDVALFSSPSRIGASSSIDKIAHRLLEISHGTGQTVDVAARGRRLRSFARRGGASPLHRTLRRSVFMGVSTSSRRWRRTLQIHMPSTSDTSRLERRLAQ